jgi:hypothetical protein
LKLSKLFFVVDQIQKTTTTFRELLAVVPTPLPKSLAMVIKTLTPLMMNLLGGMMLKMMRKKKKKKKKEKKMTHQVCFYFF